MGNPDRMRAEIAKRAAGGMPTVEQARASIARRYQRKIRRLLIIAWLGRTIAWVGFTIAFATPVVVLLLAGQPIAAVCLLPLPLICPIMLDRAVQAAGRLLTPK